MALSSSFFFLSYFLFFTFLSPPFSLHLPRVVCLSSVAQDLKDIHNNKHRYLLASENQRPGHFSTAPMGCLTASPSSGSLCSQAGLQSVSSIQERIMSTPGGEEAIERLKVHPQAFFNQKRSQGLQWINICWCYRRFHSNKWKWR